MAKSSPQQRHSPRGSDNPEEDYIRLGDQLAGRIISALKLKKDHVLLDCGCGSGRVAAGLQRANIGLNYLGFDIRVSDIVHARKVVTGENEDFQFVHLDHYNERYNQKGRFKGPENYAFPAPSGAFDRAIATSFFTHLDEMMFERTLSEISRTLNSKGRAYLTFFVLGNDRVQSPADSRQYKHKFGNGLWTRDTENPLQSVAIEQKRLLEMLARVDLKPIEFHQGGWRGGLEDSFHPDMKAVTGKNRIESGQDVFIVGK